MNPAYLNPVDDGLSARDSQEYARLKLKALEVYLEITTTSMRNKPWSGISYIDLQAGPGKNKIKGEFVLGSPLLALGLEHPFTHYWFNEIDDSLANALQERYSASPIANRVKLYREDVNTVVSNVVDELSILQSRKKKEEWGYLNVAFLDPEGLELHWSTVSQLASVPKMDLIINFSTSTILREEGSKNLESVNRFYGNNQWLEDMKISDPVKRRRALIDRYLNQLKSFGYYISENPELENHDISFKNSKKSEVYSLIFASKSELGDKFWRQSKKTASPRRLKGF